MLSHRLATVADTRQLAQMRWDFRIEEAPGITLHDHDTFIDACTDFLTRGLVAARWAYWIALDQDLITSHIYVGRIEKVPKPNKLNDSFGYVTNVYSRPAYRGKGIGAQLMSHVLNWAREQDFENLIVWPSETSVNWYRRAGFIGDPEMLTYPVRPYVG